MRIVELINSQKYHSLAAKGETVDLSKLAEAQQANVPIDVREAPPSTDAVNATVEHSQAVAGATMPTAHVPASSAPVSAVQPGAGVMPQALLNSGMHECVACDCIEHGRLIISQCKTKVSRT
jgi:hypothetical protein